MPTLEFKGKPFVYSHHLSVPFRELVVDPKKSVSPKGAKPSLDGNLIIRGDNLEALKALLPRYAGKVDVIYIDPPYNTGNEGWTYNDDVNSPLIRQWLGETVDADDLERHDKWLCMMWPRMQLLGELLSPTGVMFVSIDDNEVDHAELLIRESLATRNLIGRVIVEVNPKGRGLDVHLARTHEYVICASGGDLERALQLTKADDDIKQEYPHKDALGLYRSLELRNTHREFGKHNRPNLFYPFFVANNDVYAPIYDSDQQISSLQSRTHTVSKIPESAIRVLPLWDDGFEGCWTWSWKKAVRDIHLIDAKQVNGRWKIYRRAHGLLTGKGQKASKKLKTILNERKYHTEVAQKEVDDLMGFRAFYKPKPVALIETLVELVGKKDVILLDSFAGSGTSGHALLRLQKRGLLSNKSKFILVQLPESLSPDDEAFKRGYREVIDITRNRLEKAIKREQLGSFTYCDLGEPIDIERFFHPGRAPSYEQVARYIAYTATGQSVFDVPKNPREDWFVADVGGYRVHLIYRPELGFMRSNEAALSVTFAQSVSKAANGKPVLVYAAAKFMAQDVLTKMGITFCQLPYSVHRILGEAPDAP